MEVPFGLEEIKKVYGDPTQLVHDDGTVSSVWEHSVLESVFLPAPLPLGWDLDVKVRRIRGHKLILPSLLETLQSIHDHGLWNLLVTFDGCYNWRAKKGQSRLSTHSWGIAVDFNAATNQFRHPGDMDPRVVEEFEGRNWVWGGRWGAHYRDPMHFQYARGY